MDRTRLRKRNKYFDLDKYNRDAKKVAHNLRHYWHIPRGPINNLVEIVEDAGIVVYLMDFGTQKVDGFTFLNNW